MEIPNENISNDKNIKDDKKNDDTENIIKVQTLMEFKDLSKLRIRRSEKIARALELEEIILRSRMLITYRQMKHISNYKKILAEIAELEKRQLFNYSIENEIHITSLSQMVTDIKPDISDLIGEIYAIKPEFDKLTSEIAEINNLKPDIVYTDQIPIAEHRKSCGLSPPML